MKTYARLTVLLTAILLTACEGMVLPGGSDCEDNKTDEMSHDCALDTPKPAADVGGDPLPVITISSGMSQAPGYEHFRSIWFRTKHPTIRLCAHWSYESTVPGTTATFPTSGTECFDGEVIYSYNLGYGVEFLCQEDSDVRYEVFTPPAGVDVSEDNTEIFATSVLDLHCNALDGENPTVPYTITNSGPWDVFFEDTIRSGGQRLALINP